jgi:tetratricopeptide (TPR) repeat protein
MTDYKQTYENLLADADALPSGDTRVAIVEKAMQLVDLHQDERLQFKIRLRYIREIHEAGGFAEKYVAIFPWLLAYTKKTESHFDKYEVLWYYKWVIGCMPNFPTVSKTQIESALLDLRDRYREVSPTDLVYHSYARDMYIDLGDLAQAKAHQKEIEAIGGRDILSDCKACTLNSYVAYLVAIREVRQAIIAAQPLLSGSLSCHSVPQTTFARLIPEFLLLGRHDEAKGMASRLLKKLKKEDRDDYARGYSLLGYMAVMKKYEKGISLFKDHFENAWRVKSKWGKLHFYAYAAFLFREVQKKSDITKVELTLPSNFPLYTANNQYDISILLPWLEKEVQDLVAAFNKRNGNTYFSTLVEFINSLETVVWQ